MTLWNLLFTHCGQAIQTIFVKLLLCEDFHSSFCANFVLLIVATQTPSVFSQQKIHNEINSFMFFTCVLNAITSQYPY